MQKKEMIELIKISNKIDKCYTQLINEYIYYDKKITSNNIIVKKICKLLIKEYTLYEKIKFIDENDIEDIINKLFSIDLNTYTKRIITRLYSLYNKQSASTRAKLKYIYPEFDSDYFISFNDIIECSIIIDVFKNIIERLNAINCTNQQQKLYKERLLKYAKSDMLLKYSNFELTELVYMMNNFNFEDISRINTLDIEMNIYNADYNTKSDFTKLYNSNTIDMIKMCLKYFTTYSVEPYNIEQIYFGMYYESYIDVLLNYLNKDELIEVYKLLNQFNIKEKIIKDTIKLNIKKKIF